MFFLLLQKSQINKESAEKILTRTIEDYEKSAHKLAPFENTHFLNLVDNNKSICKDNHD